MHKTKFFKSLLTLVLVFSFVFEILAPCFPVFAASDYTYTGGAGVTVSDKDTSTLYTLSLGDNASTEYAGRIWTDKSVFAGDVTFETFGGGNQTIPLNEAGNGEDFLIAYSALASSQAVSGSTHAPVDVVFVIDLSGSMSNSDSGMDNGKSRIANTVEALNDAIEAVLAMNEYARVAVVGFSSTATTLLPLDRYSQVTEREWVDPDGRFGPQQGRYEEVTRDYFSLSTTSPSSNNATLYIKATGTSGTVDDDITVSGGTNIQVGLHQGFSILANADSTTVNINGSNIPRVPSVVLLSDGAPTYSSNSSSWWSPANNNSNGAGTNPSGNSYFIGNGFKALLTGAYMKQAVSDKYSVDATVYSIGMGISKLTGAEKNLAYVTIDPAQHWDDSNNAVAQDMKAAWSTYLAGGTPSVNVGERQGYNGFDDDYYTVSHPAANDISGDALKKLVDDYYDADNASAVTSVFSQIVSSISISAPQVPTEIKGNTPVTESGYITYTDPIGDYMEIKDVKAILYAGALFTAKSVVTAGNVTTYTFSGSVQSPVYGDQDIRDILITVTENAGKQTLTVKIPASVIPLRINTVELNEDGTVKSHTNNGAFPTRVIYSVGLKSEILKESDGGAVYVDTTKLSPDYLAANTNADGSVNFFSNLYTNMHEINGSTVGDAMVDFEPSHTNAFYYILEDMPIYKDEALTRQVTAAEGIDPATTYYYKTTYYHGVSTEAKAAPRTGAQLLKTEIVEIDGYLYRAEGSPRLNRILLFEGTKSANATGTAEDFYAPEFRYAEGSSSAYDGRFTVHLGNNGKLSLAAGGNLQISKSVAAGVGLTAPDQSFEFTLDLDGDKINGGEYLYTIVNAAGTQVVTGHVSKNNTKISLKDGQTATVYALPPGTTYTVTEASAAGFAAESSGESGTISAGQTSVVSFTNTYNVTPVTWPTNDTLKGQKVLSGRTWSANDAFTFLLMPYGNEPLPAGYDPAAGITVTAPDAPNGQTASFDFGNIQFTAPGLYRYTIMEKEPDSNAHLPGMSYSKAVYRLAVTVVDNGDGTLSVTSSDLQRLYDDSANPLFTYVNNQIVMNSGEEAQDTIVFTNTYSASSVTRVPVALKDYTDHSGEHPLESGMFTFELKALGIVENGVPVSDISGVPMPAGSVNGVITTSNEGHNITFPAVEFTQSLIPQGASSVTFRYQMREVAPANPVNGMTYDSTVYTVDVVVSIDPNSHILNVEAIYAGGEAVPTFINTYTPTPVSTDIDVSKTLIGRDMKNGEEFQFVLSANAATSNAIREGIVVVPSSTMTVSGAKDGVKTEFAFENIQFKKSGTYVFTVSETAGTAPSVVYDSTVYIVTVVVNDADGDGNLNIASVTYSGGKAAADFVNTYSATFQGTPVSLSATKNLTGKSLLAGEFYFQVAEYFNGAFVKDYLVTHSVDTSATGGVYTGAIELLKDVTYTEAGQYIYYFSEQIPATPVGGTEYDENRFRYVVTVEDVDQVGKLTVTSKSLQKLENNLWVNADDVTFTNIYTPAPTTLTLPLIKKLLSGYRAEALQAGEFQFALAEVSSSTPGGMQLPATTTVSNAANGDIVFDPITFTKAGIYVVSIKEVIPASKLPGVTYSTQEMTAVIEVVDDRNGTLTAALTQYLGGDTFVNLYEAEPADVTISITKDFTGRDNNGWLATDVFEFEIEVLDPDTAAAIENGDLEFPTDPATQGIVRKSIDSTTPNKTVSGTIRVNTPGTYKFIVRELTGAIPGVHYDSAAREITLIATDDSANAQITAKVLINGVETTAMTFSNVYDTQYAEISGHDHLFIEKIFTGRENDLWLDSDKFVFTLEANDTVTKNAVTAGLIEMPASSLTVSNANKAHPHFGNILFHAAGTYTFKVTEMPSGLSGVTDDVDTDRIVTVQVTDNNQGVLVAAIAPGSEELRFTNTYSADPVTLIGSTNLTITKNLVGRNWLASDSFGFTLAPTGVETQEAVNAGDIVMPAAGITITAQAGHSGTADGHFGDIVFKKAGIYRFIITENTGSIDRMSYSTHRYYVVVTVTDNNEGALVATPSYYGTSTFENTYSPDSVRAVFRGLKTLRGKLDLAADDFTFVISALTNGAPMPSATTATNAADGSISFGEIWFSAPGVYQYKIEEVSGSIPGVSYDKNAVTATVTVTYDEDTGYFSIVTVYSKENTQGETPTFSFVNEYKAAASAPVPLQAQKVVSPSEGNSYTMAGGEFQFKIEAIGNAPMPTVPTASNNAQGIIDFGSVQFTEEGTYQYTVYEVVGSKTGFTYDQATYTITVEVTDVVALAKLVTNIKITDMNGADASIVFNNKYAPKETSVTIFGSKELQGGHKQLAADEFQFSIEAVTSGAPLPAELTVKNGADGSFRFDAITYNKVGNYVYQITEKNLGADGYTYDDTVYTVLVTVTDENGELKATVDGLGTEQAPAIRFVNKYVPSSVTAVLGADGELQKELSGRDLNAEEFIFAVLDGNLKELATAKNTAEGTFQFSIEFTAAGTYNYTIVERNNGLAGVTYDESVYGVEIVIVDEAGHLKVDAITYTLETAKVEEVVFTNTYDATDGEILISATKNLTGRELVDGEFKFLLVDKEGNTVATATNTADGKIVFDKIVVTKAGTYTFTVLEETGTQDYVTYDKTQFVVVVEVTDNTVTGQLEVGTPVIKKAGDDNAVAEIVFLNTYVVPMPDNPKTGDNTRLGLWLTVMFISAVGLVGTILYERNAKKVLNAEKAEEDA